MPDKNRYHKVKTSRIIKDRDEQNMHDQWNN